MLTRARFDSRDAVVALLLVLFIVGYLGGLPRSLGRADESHFLYEAKRIRDGDVMYRDFFQFVTPGASYAMAFFFSLFGTTLGTARIVTAVLHAFTAALMYATARRLGVRVALAVLPSLAYIALCQSVWQFASWHWFSTFFMVLALYAIVRVPWSARPRTAILPGLVTGLLIGVQQQKGAAIAAGIVALFIADHLIERLRGAPEPWQRLAERLAWFAAGGAMVVVPLLVAFVALAGFGPVFDALVRFPLVNYRHSFKAAWGAVFAITRGYASYTYPELLRWMPIFLLPACLRLVIGLRLGTDRGQLRILLVLIASAASAVLAIWYFPGIVHLAFVAPVFFIAAAEAVEWLLDRVLPPARLNAAVGWAVALTIGAFFLIHLRDNADRLAALFPYAHETAFGRIDFKDRWEGVLIDKTRELLREAGSNELFAYPNTSHPYLTTGAKNPTPYQYLYAPVSPAEHTARTIEILKTHPIPYVVRQGFYATKNDPIAKTIDEYYDPMRLPEILALGEFATLKLYRRKNGAAPAPESAD